MSDIYNKNIEHSYTQYHYILLQNLMEGLLNNIGATNLLLFIEEILDCPIMVTDMGFRIVAESPAASKNLDYHYFYQDNTFVNEGCIELIRTNYIFKNMRNKDFSKVLLHHPTLSSFLVASVKVSYADVLMLIVFYGDSSPKDSDFILLKKISQILSLEFQKENFFNRQRLDIPNHIIISLLSGKDVPQKDILYKLPYIKWTTSKEFYIMVVSDSDNQYLDIRISSVINALKLYIPTENCVVYESNIIVYLTAEIFQNICNTKREEFIEFIKSTNLRCAVSPIFFDITLSRYYYLLALKVLKTAQKYNIFLALFEEMTYHLISNSLETNFNIRDFCHPSILKLLKFDFDNDTELIETLKCYFDYKTSPDIAAEKLYIHRSTLFYRLKKIRTITGIDLDQPMEISSLYLSLKFIYIYGKDFFI